MASYHSAASLRGEMGMQGEPGVPGPDNTEMIKAMEKRIARLELMMETGLTSEEMDTLDKLTP